MTQFNHSKIQIGRSHSTIFRYPRAAALNPLILVYEPFAGQAKVQANGIVSFLTTSRFRFSSKSAAEVLLNFHHQFVIAGWIEIPDRIK